MQALEYAQMDHPNARRLMENSGTNMNNLIQMSRIGFDPYSRLNNEAFSFYRIEDLIKLYYQIIKL